MQMHIDQVLRSFTPVFGFEPRVYFGDCISHQDLHVILTTSEVKKIFDNYSLFLEALTIAIYPHLGPNEGNKNLANITQ